MLSNRSFRILLIVLLCVVQVSSVGFASSPSSHSMDVIHSGLNQAINVLMGPDDKLYISEYGGGNITRVDKNGQNKEVFASGLNQPIGMAFDQDDNLYVAEHAGRKVVKIEPNGTKTTIKSETVLLTGLELDSDGWLYVADYQNGKILKMKLDGSDSTDFVTGLGNSTIIGMTIDADNNIFVADFNGGKIKKINPSASVTDFITGLSTPTWVTYGSDGFFYISLGSRLIEKYDNTGEKLDAFKTPLTFGYPWGTYISETGYIYYQTRGSTCSKIVGVADTVSKTSLKLVFNTALSTTETSFDPSAFTISGVASAPTVTQAVYSESNVYLTLDKPIDYTDTNIKISYNETGVNNLVSLHSGVELDNYSNMPVNNNVLRVTGVPNLADIHVDHETDLNTLRLQFPSSVSVNISDGTVPNYDVTWNAGTPTYDGNMSGTYIFAGTITTSDNVSNSSNLEASLRVVVSAPDQSSDATLSEIGLNVGSLNFEESARAYTINVSNNTSTITISPVANETHAIMTINGSPLLDGSATINLNVGSNTVTILVTAEDGLTTQTYTLTINRQSANDTTTSTPKSEAAPMQPAEPQQDMAIVIVNGQAQNAVKESVSIVDDQIVVTIEIDSNTIKNKINAVLDGNAQSLTNSLQIPVSNQNVDAVKVVLSGDTIKTLEDHSFEIIFKTNNVDYVIPAEEFNLMKIAQSLGVKEDGLNNIKFEVRITSLPKNLVNQYNEIANKNGSELIFPPVGFEIDAIITLADGSTKEVVISKFDKYVKRVLEIPDNVDPVKITTGILFNTNGTYNHVPTNVFQKDDKWYATLNSLTNSAYSILWNPVTVKGVEKHWSKDVVNDMASRLIIFNPQSFEPDKAITRGDFAEYMVRALGIYQEDLKLNNKFIDVAYEDDRAIGILIAHEYGLVSGYPDGSFKPEASITREEAMTMYQKAMKITKLVGTHTDKYQTYADYGQVSQWAKAHVKEVLSAQVFKGTAAEQISPKSNLTYSEAVQALKNLLVESKLINK